MTLETKVRKIGNSYGILLPKEALEQINATEGTSLYLSESTERSLKITASNPGFSEMMAIAEEGMRDYNNALRELAK
jgi:putative addiction module antidote